MMLDLRAITARLAATTPGAWTWEPAASGPVREWSGTCLVLTNQEDGPRARLIGTISTHNDARLVACAPSDIRDLVAEVERLREAIKAHEKTGRRISNNPHDRDLWEVLIDEKKEG